MLQAAKWKRAMIFTQHSSSVILWRVMYSSFFTLICRHTQCLFIHDSNPIATVPYDTEHTSSYTTSALDRRAGLGVIAS